MAKDIKDIDKEISRLMEMKEQIIEINNTLKHNKHVKALSPSKFHELDSRGEIIEDYFIYLELDPEIGQYIEGYIE